MTDTEQMPTLPTNLPVVAVDPQAGPVVGWTAPNGDVIRRVLDQNIDEQVRKAIAKMSPDSNFAVSATVTSKKEVVASVLVRTASGHVSFAGTLEKRPGVGIDAAGSILVEF